MFALTQYNELPLIGILSPDSDSYVIQNAVQKLVLEEKFQNRVDLAISNDEVCPDTNFDYCFDITYTNIGIGFDKYEPDLSAALGPSTFNVVLSVQAVRRTSNDALFDYVILGTGELYDFYDFAKGKITKADLLGYEVKVDFNTDGAWVQFGYTHQPAGRVFVTSIPFEKTFTAHDTQ